MQPYVLALQHLATLVNVDAHPAIAEFADQNVNVLGGKSLKTKLAATNATMHVIAV